MRKRWEAFFVFSNALYKGGSSMECAKHKGVEVRPIFEGVGWSRRVVGHECPECKKEEADRGKLTEFSSGNGWAAGKNKII